MIELKHISKKFKTPAGEKIVFSDFSLRIEDGSFLGIAGKSGSGKSTLISLIAFLQKPTDGKILIDGAELSSLSDLELSRFRNKNIGFISQEQSFLENLTVLDNVRLPFYLSKRDSQINPSERALSLLSSFGISQLASSYPKNLSGGENHRVLLARALMNEPKIILADEVTDSVDREQTKNIVRILKNLSRQGKTVILVSHDKAVLSECDKIVEI